MSRSVVIAGSDGDVGRAVARAFREAGFRTIGLSRSARHQEHLDESLKVDLANRAALAAVVAGLASVDVVVNAAGLYRRTEETAVDPELFANNLGIADNLLTLFTPRLADTPGARIITIGSLDGLYPNVNSFAYSVGKGAIRTLVALYKKAHQGSALNFDLISPGAINTRMRADKAEDKARLLQPDDVAKVCVFLGALGSHATVGEIVIHPKSFTYTT
jgi:NADP-dependent 3-hydroxy acid dehydrogenase YdfG